ncbi:MAG: GIY-YIG nuclease family protein [Actinomycetota bacterium]
MALQDETLGYLAATIHSRAEVLARPSPVPVQPGVYGWWFRELPAEIETRECASRDGLTLLYAGISPKEPPKNGRAPSRQSLRSRIQTHYTGNAEGSTLRRSLGCLLATRLGIELRRYGSGTRLHFGFGERALSSWMDRNAFVSWLAMPQPWLFEHGTLGTLDLPLNLDSNEHNAFHPILTAARAEAAQRARSLPALPNPGSGGAGID